MNATQTKADLIARYRHLSRLMADETMPDSDYRALAKARDAVQAQIEAV